VRRVELQLITGANPVDQALHRFEGRHEPAVNRIPVEDPRKALRDHGLTTRFHQGERCVLSRGPAPEVRPRYNDLVVALVAVRLCEREVAERQTLRLYRHPAHRIPPVQFSLIRLSQAVHQVLSRDDLVGVYRVTDDIRRATDQLFHVKYKVYRKKSCYYSGENQKNLQ